MTDKKKYKERSRLEVLSFMASLCVCTGDTRSAEGLLMEMLACIAFTDWDETATHISS